MKTVLVYYSQSGNTAAIAANIARILNADLLRVFPKKAYPDKGFRKYLWGGKSAVMGESPALEPYDFNDSYDTVIIGTPVWASTFAPPIRTFLAENKETLANKKFAAFACLGGNNPGKTFEKLQKEPGVDSLVATAIFPDTMSDEQRAKTIDAFCDQLR